MNRPQAIGVRPRHAAVLLALLAAGCGAFDRLSSDDRAALSTCRSQADRVYAARNREAIYTSRDETGTPYSGSGLPADPGRGLADKYAHQNLVEDCLARGSASNALVPSGRP